MVCELYVSKASGCRFYFYFLSGFKSWVFLRLGKKEKKMLASGTRNTVNKNNTTSQRPRGRVSRANWSAVLNSVESSSNVRKGEIIGRMWSLLVIFKCSFSRKEATFLA